MGIINFFWSIYFLTIGAVLLEVFFAWKEKTLWPNQDKKISLPLFKHGGIVIGDLLLLPVFNAIVTPFFHFHFWLYVFFGLVAFSLTWFLHRMWWPTEDAKLNFMSPNWRGSKRKRRFWHRDLSTAGWIHLLFMSAESVIISGYIFSRVPAVIISYVCVIFFFFIPFSYIEPELVIKRSLRIILMNTTLLYLFVVAITYLKLHF